MDGGTVRGRGVGAGGCEDSSRPWYPSSLLVKWVPQYEGVSSPPRRTSGVTLSLRLDRLKEEVRRRRGVVENRPNMGGTTGKQHPRSLGSSGTLEGMRGTDGVTGGVEYGDCHCPHRTKGGQNLFRRHSCRADPQHGHTEWGSGSTRHFTGLVVHSP